MSSPGYPRFALDAVLVVDAHNGSETWTGARWNEYVERAERTQSMVTARLIECPPSIRVPVVLCPCGAYLGECECAELAAQMQSAPLVVIRRRR